MPTGRIWVVGLGPGPLELLSWGAVRALQEADRVLVRTAHHPTVAHLAELGITVRPLDEIYERAPDMGQVYRLLADEVMRQAEGGRVAYAVPGHPTVGETSVAIILQEAPARGLQVTVTPAVSALDVVLAAVRADPLDGLSVCDAQALPPRPDPAAAGLYLQVDDRLRAGDLKLWLLDTYPADHPVAVVSAASLPEQAVRRLPLAELDGGEYFDHLTTVYVPPLPADQRKATLPDLVELMARLRAPEGGCPWDREQTHQSLRRCLLEECHEVLEALDEGDPAHLQEELGDLLLQILFHAELAQEEGEFDMTEVMEGLRRKLVHRHPHVFGESAARSAEAVLAQWERLKREAKPERTSVLGEWPGSLPALMQALLVQKRAARVGFDWPDYTGPLAKVREETDELLAEWGRPARLADRLEWEAGDLLFAVVNLCRFMGVDAEQALRGGVARFVGRFHAIERAARGQGRALPDMSLDEMDALWEDAKGEA